MHLALGFGLQVMDATVTLTSADGSARRSNRSLGPVPLLQLAFQHELGAGWFWGAEAAGFYAPINYLTRGDVDVMGAFVDASVRVGHHLGSSGIGFVNVRWLGGGAEGTLGPDPFDDGYEANWLHFLTLSVGIQLEVL